MRELFQKIENGSMARTMFSEPEPMYQAEGILAQFEEERKRPSSIILPRQSALKKNNSQEAISKRPRSLRFLDPKDQKLYMAVSHKDFLNSLREPTIDELIPAVEQLEFDQNDSEKAIKSFRRLSSPPPSIPVERGDLADNERTFYSDWNINEESDLEGIRDMRYNLKSMPIFPTRDFTSGESSDISGCEGDLEDKENRTRRGSVSTL